MPAPRCLAIGRLSDPDTRRDPDEQGRSLKRQEATCRALCDRLGGLWLDFVWDEDITGGTMYRPAVLEVTRRIQAGEVDIILADEIDRLHRNVPAFEMWVATVLVPHGVTIQLDRGFYDTSTAANWFASQQQGLVAEFYRRQISDKIKSANAHKRRKGLLMGGRCFATLSNGGPVRVRDDATYPFLLELFNRLDCGDSARAIARDFDKRGVPTIDGGKWEGATVRSIATCRWYIGQTLHRGELVCDSDGQPIVYEHDCMVPRELWDRVNGRLGKGVNCKDGHVYLLQDLVICSQWRMTAPRKHEGSPAQMRGRLYRGRRIYRRQDQEGEFYSAVPIEAVAIGLPATVPADDDPDTGEKGLETVVVERVLRAFDEDELLADLLQQRETQAASTSDRSRTAARQLRDCRKKLVQTEKGLAFAVRAGHVIAAELMEREASDLRQRISKAESTLSTLHKEIRTLDAVGPDMADLIRQAWETGDRPALRKLLQTAISYVDITTADIHVAFRGKSSPEVQSPRGLVLQFRYQARGRHTPRLVPV